VSGLVLCGCGLAKDTVTVVTADAETVLLVCEHCDQPCGEKPCTLCRQLARTAAKS
jgi:hypothetical protein